MVRGLSDDSKGYGDFKLKRIFPWSNFNLNSFKFSLSLSSFNIRLSGMRGWPAPNGIMGNFKRVTPII